MRNSRIRATVIALVIGMGSFAAGSSAQELTATENPLVGKWLCDMSLDAGVVVKMAISETEWYVLADAGGEIMEMQGTYDFADNKIILHSEEGDIEADYLPDTDQISAFYQGIEYVFDRVKEEEVPEVKKEAEKPG